MNGKQARARRRMARQGEAARILASLVGTSGVYLVDVDDDRDGDIVRITAYDTPSGASTPSQPPYAPYGHVLFEDPDDAADAAN